MEITDVLIGFEGTDCGDLGHEGFVIERIRTRENRRAPALVRPDDIAPRVRADADPVAL